MLKWQVANTSFVILTILIVAGASLLNVLRFRYLRQYRTEKMRNKGKCGKI